MKSSETAPSRVSQLAHVGVFVLAAFLIGVLRPGLVERFAKLRVQADDYLLPDPNVTLVASLGYRSALADFIFGHVLVSHGLHFQEKRLFEHVGDYLDVINVLDPKFRDPYRYADTLLTLQPKSPPPAFYRKARVILERGLKELPYDQELWTTTGQFLAYLAPARLTDAAEKDEYRRAGARCLMRACELIGSDENLPFHCITAANLLTQQGNREAARRFLTRLREMTDSDELRELAQRKLNGISGDETDEDQERAQRRERLFRQAVLDSGMTFASRIELDVLGPSWDTVACAGRAASNTAGCKSSWRTFFELEDSGESTRR